MLSILFCLAFLASSLLPCWASLVQETLVITSELGAPDGQERYLIQVNEQFPGPTLTFDEDDDVEITVVNLLSEDTTVHWHGLAQEGSPWSDGVPGLSQKPIQPGMSFVYKFKASPAGTYWYHSHSRAQLMDGLYGALFIRPKQEAEKPWYLISNDTDDIQQMDAASNNPNLIILSDWTKFNSSQYLDAQVASGLQLFCVDSILVNGKGSVYCPPQSELIAQTAPILNASFYGGQVTDKGCFPFVNTTEGKWLSASRADKIPAGLQSGCVASNGSQEVIEVNPSNGWASLNFIGAETLKELVVQLDEHEMYVYEVDGHYIYPRAVNAIAVEAGERYSVMIKLDKPSSDYTLRVPDSGDTQVISGFATVRYQSNPSLGESKAYLGYNGLNATDTDIVWLDKLDLPPYPPTAPANYSDITHVLRVGRWSHIYDFTFSGSAMYPTEWHADDPFLYNPNSTDAFNSSLVLRTNYGQWVDLVVELGSHSDWRQDFAHAVHKHSSKFWLVGNGAGEWEWNSTAEAVAAMPDAFNFVNPPYRDTALNNGGADFQPESWMVLRYQATIPGAWFLHCHVDTHLAEGFAMVLLDAVDRWPEIPSGYGVDERGYEPCSCPGS